jgi:4-amino-4-deoxy-L-arabinose transferase-like glycosyltransferase
MRSVAPELLVLLFGILLRLSLNRWYYVGFGYDYPAHHQYIRYLVEHGHLPPYDLNAASYHPPLFYLLAALIEGSGLSPQAVGWISIISSCLQLVLLWWGMRLYIPGWRVAHVLALAVAAVVPASVQVAGMVSNEALSDLFCTGATLLLPQIFLRRGRSALTYGASAGACVGTALLTKISGSIVLVAFFVALGLLVCRTRKWTPIRNPLRAAALMMVVIAALCGWHYTRHKVLYGKFVLTGYDQWHDVDPTQKKPYLDRRTLGFVLGWDSQIVAKRPFWPVASVPHARFWPMLVATTFSDYYNAAFAPKPSPGLGGSTLAINGRWMRPSAIAPARRSVAGGIALAVLTVAGWLCAARALWYRRDHGRLTILLVGLFAVLGQLHFAIQYPYDPFGPIKGAYLQFAGPVYCGLTGFTLAALWRHRTLLSRLLFSVGVVAILAIASYTLYARIVLPISS